MKFNMAAMNAGRESAIHRQSQTGSGKCETVPKPNHVQKDARLTYRNYIPFMSPKLQQENIDGVVICSAKDHNAAQIFINRLSKMSYNFSQQAITPRLELLDNTLGTDIESLEEIVARSTYIFLFLTKSFCEEQLSVLVSHACLYQTLRDLERKWSVIPVHTEREHDRSYSTPLFLTAIKPIQFFREGQYHMQNVVKLFQSKAAERLRREVTLNKKRLEYFNANKDDLIAMAELVSSDSSTVESIELHCERSQSHETGLDSITHLKTVEQNRISDYMRQKSNSTSNLNHDSQREDLLSDTTSCSDNESLTRSYNNLIVSLCRQESMFSVRSEPSLSEIESLNESSCDSLLAQTGKPSHNFTSVKKEDSRRCSLGRINSLYKDYNQTQFVDEVPTREIHHHYCIHNAENIYIGDHGTIVRSREDKADDDLQSRSSQHQQSSNNQDETRGSMVATPVNSSLQDEGFPDLSPPMSLNSFFIESSTEGMPHCVDSLK